MGEEEILFPKDIFETARNLVCGTDREVVLTAESHTTQLLSV